MKPVEYVSIGGYVFSLENDACEAAKQYLSELETFYSKVESGSEVAKGVTLTLTATPKTGKQFVKWSNGSTANPTSIVTTGDPIAIVGIFSGE